MMSDNVTVRSNAIDLLAKALSKIKNDDILKQESIEHLNFHMSCLTGRVCDKKKFESCANDIIKYE